MTPNQTIINIANRHGFEAWILNDENVVVKIPWVHSESGEKGTELQLVRNKEELKAVLGY